MTRLTRPSVRPPWFIARDWCSGAGATALAVFGVTAWVRLAPDPVGAGLPAMTAVNSPSQSLRFGGPTSQLPQNSGLATRCTFANPAHIVVEQLVEEVVPQLAGNAFALDVGVAPGPLHGRFGQRRGGHGIAEEGVLAVAEPVLYRAQVVLVENHPFQHYPLPVQFDLDPGVEDFPRRHEVHERGHRAFLQALVDGEGPQPAGNAEGAEQGHQQVGLGVAVPQALGKNRRGGQAVGTGVVTEQDLVAAELVDGTGRLFRWQLPPAARVDEAGDRRCVEVEYFGAL
ncbi:hypothetical protein COLO4_01312 [Corchorus olitorius]|uniref:Uncharacterized protein n=1 Tax=Corchorus olitorius TaxID=93759 RepID=A0A1R3L2S9_9ROSI|nr:hypothetical protein COLO4_01312 [Corchorus olitorius]